MSNTQGICGCLGCVESYLRDYTNFSENGNLNLLPAVNTIDEDPDLDASGYLVDSPPVDQVLNENLHLVWYGHFQRKFDDFYHQFRHQWVLDPILPDEPAPQMQNCVWSTVELAKVRFICEDCGKTWTSMRGIGQFRAVQFPGCYKLQFSLLGQQCQGCDSQEFQSAIWYPEEVVKVLNGVFDKIKTEFYKLPALPSPNSQRPGLRMGQPRRGHDSHKCQACTNGVCSLASSPIQSTLMRRGHRQTPPNHYLDDDRTTPVLFPMLNSRHRVTSNLSDESACDSYNEFHKSQSPAQYYNMSAGTNPNGFNIPQSQSMFAVNTGRRHDFRDK